MLATSEPFSMGSPTWPFVMPQVLGLVLCLPAAFVLFRYGRWLANLVVDEDEHLELGGVAVEDRRYPAGFSSALARCRRIRCCLVGARVGRSWFRPRDGVPDGRPANLDSDRPGRCEAGYRRIPAQRWDAPCALRVRLPARIR